MAILRNTQITGSLGVTQGINSKELHLGTIDNPMTPGRIYLWSEEKMDYLPIYAEDYDIIFDAPMTSVIVPNLTVNGRIVAQIVTASLNGTASWATNVVNGSTGTSLTTGSTYPITASWAEKATTATSATTATTATNAGTASVVRIEGNEGDTDYRVLFGDDSTDDVTKVYEFSSLTFNPSTGVLTAPTFAGTASQAISASYAPSVAGGTSLTTGSTYPITASWALNSNTASLVIETSTGTGNLVRATEPTMTSATINTSLLLGGGGTNTELNPDTNTLTITNEFATSPVVINVSDGNITANNFYGTASQAISASYAPTGTAELPVGSSQQITSSWAINAKTASRVNVTPSEGAVAYNLVLHNGYASAELLSDQNSLLNYNPMTAVLTADSIVANSGFTGNLTGTGSWATKAISSSHALKADVTTETSTGTGIIVRQGDATLNIGYTTLTPYGDGMGIFDSDYSLYIAHFTAGKMIVDSQIEGLFVGPHTGSTRGTASWATNAVTATSALGLSGNATSATVTITDTGDDIVISSPAQEQLQINNLNWDAPVLFTNNEITVGNVIGNLTGTASLVQPTQNYLSSDNVAGYTASFNAPYQRLNLTGAVSVTFTGSNLPASGKIADTTIVIRNTHASFNSLSIPSSWACLGGSWPTGISGSKVGMLWLRAHGDGLIVGSYNVQN